METLLNVVWVLLVVAALCVWQRRWVRQRAALRRNRVQEWIAFVCVMVMMFYVVSMTDDLHPEIFLCDGSTSGRRTALVRPPAHRPAVKIGGAASPGAAVVAPADFANPLGIAEAITLPVQSAFSYFAVDRAIAPRAPPLDR
jgi:hypothetical protein